MISFQFNYKLFIKLVITFFIFTIIGTLTHEIGHIVIAKSLGREVKLHYGSMSSFYKREKTDIKYLEYKKIIEQHREKIINKIDFIEKDRYLYLRDYLKKKYPYNKKESILIVLGGPLQTMLTSFLGLCLLIYRRYRVKNKFVFLDWIGVFLALFALREIFNFVSALFSKIFYHKSNFHGDEFRISRFLEFNEWVIPFIMLIIGSLISFHVIFKILPLKYRLTFIISGFVGGISGFVIWFNGLGSFLIP